MSTKAARRLFNEALAFYLEANIYHPLTSTDDTHPLNSTDDTHPLTSIDTHPLSCADRQTLIVAIKALSKLHAHSYVQAMIRLSYRHLSADEYLEILSPPQSS